MSPEIRAKHSEAARRLWSDPVFRAKQEAAGALRAHGTHLHAKRGLRTGTYNTWTAMRQRCSDPKRHNFKFYGGRGIRVCERWRSFENFLADMGERPVGMSIDRVDVNGHYEPANCRWSTMKEQCGPGRRRKAA